MECQVTGCTTITWGARGSPRAMDVQRWRCHVPTEITPLFGLHGANRHDKLRRASEAGAGDEVQLGTWRGGAGGLLLLLFKTAGGLSPSLGSYLFL